MFLIEDEELMFDTTAISKHINESLDNVLGEKLLDTLKLVDSKQLTSLLNNSS